MKTLSRAAFTPEEIAAVAAALPWAAFARRRIIVTGASGLIGAAIVEMLQWGSTGKGAALQVVAAGRDPAALQARFGEQVASLRYDACAPVGEDMTADLVIHCASAASPELFVAQPLEVIHANVTGVANLLDHARRGKIKKLVYVSSSEVYGRGAPSSPAGFTETDYGLVDPMSVRSSYPEAKRAAENLCAAYASEYGVNVSIVRPGHVYGPTASVRDKRISSAFAYQAARGEPIVLKSAGAQVRSYVHALDCAAAILTVAARGEKAVAYNIAARAFARSIRQVAQLLADAGDVPLESQSPCEQERRAFNAMDDSRLDASRLEALGWRAVVTPEQGFRRTVERLREKLLHERKEGSS